MNDNSEMNEEIEISLVSLVLRIVGSKLLSLLVLCGLVKLITLCFGLTFTWQFAIGIWLIIFGFNLLVDWI